MNHIPYLLSVLLVVSFNSIGYRQLNWSDFKGTPPPVDQRGGTSASTFTYWILYPNQDSRGRYHCTVSCKFEDSLSWTVETTDKYLPHERLHFLVSAVKCAMFNRELKKYDGCGEQGYKIVESLWDVRFKQLEKEQNIFDAESDGGNILSTQKKWQQRYDQLLKQLQ